MISILFDIKEPSPQERIEELDLPISVQNDSGCTLATDLIIISRFLHGTGEFAYSPSFQP